MESHFTLGLDIVYNIKMIKFSPSRDQEFVIRLTPNGRILDCDERIKGLLELVPQEVIGTSLYDHLHRNDIPRIVEVGVIHLIHR